MTMFLKIIFITKLDYLFAKPECISGFIICAIVTACKVSNNKTRLPDLV